MALREAYEKARQHKKLLIWIIIVFAVALILIALFLRYLLFTYPVNQVSQYGITNATEKASLINQYRTTSIQFIATLAQIIGGGAVLVGLYFAWGNLKVAQATLESNQKKAQKELEVALANLESDQKNAQRNVEISLATLDSNIKNAQKSLEVSQEGQITERFTRAVDQLGSEKLEIRLGGIYALERIANESEKDYWPIMKILAAYIREKSPIKRGNTENKDCEEQEKDKELPTDIQVILEVICKREHTSNEKLDLRNVNIRKARLFKAHIEWADFSGADIWKAELAKAHLENATFVSAYLENASLVGAHLENARMLEAHLERAYLQGIDLKDATLIESHLDEAHIENAVLIRAFLEETHFDRAHIEGAHFEYAHLKGAYLIDAHLKGTHFEIANLEGAHFEGADLEGAHFEGADLRGASIKGVKNLTVDQLFNVKTLYNAELDDELLIQLKEKRPDLFEKAL